MKQETTPPRVVDWNHSPPSWPPPDSYEILGLSSGRSGPKYGDNVWDLSTVARKPLRLDFSCRACGKDRVSRENIQLFKQIVAWYLWRAPVITSVRSIKARFAILTPLFVICSQTGVLASRTYRYPSIIEQLARSQRASSANDLISTLHTLLQHRDLVGFQILDESGIRHLSRLLPNHQSRQTAYIPSRIWLYQLARLQEFMDDFSDHADALERCYHACLRAYIDYFGSIEKATEPASTKSCRGPFSAPGYKSSKANARYLGPFSSFAREFGVADLFSKWLLHHGESPDGAGRGVSMLASYFTMLGKVGIAHIVNSTMMRIEEAWSLRCDTLVVENDERFGSFYLLRGETTKTVADQDAHWVACPSVRKTVEALVRVSKLRMLAAAGNPRTSISADQPVNPFLVPRQYEPWANARNIDLPHSVRPQYASYKDLIRNYPNLMSEDALRVTKSDLEEALLVTPDLNPETYHVGAVWPLSWHQLRRTGAVNLQASGIVSDSSIQYQLKHTSRAMSLYYGQGYSGVRLSEETRNRYLRAMYEGVAREVQLWRHDYYVSPHGKERKEQALRAIEEKDLALLQTAAQDGSVSWRETLLGGCMKKGPCEYGGIDNVVRCTGSDGNAPCVEALFDRRKLPTMQRALKVIDARLVDEPTGTPYYDSLTKQRLGLEHAIATVS